MLETSVKLGSKDYFKLVELTVERYRHAGRFVQGFVRGKLHHDPVYRALLELNCLPSHGRLIDLGCGRGILLNLLAANHQINHPGNKLPEIQGMELQPKHARIARESLEHQALITCSDIRYSELQACQTLILLDVLMYMQRTEQEAVLNQAARALQAGGYLIMREADAAAGLRYWLTIFGERLCALSRGHWRQSYAYRSQQEWQKQLIDRGFEVAIYPMSQSTPFANNLYVARKKEQVTSHPHKPS